MVGFRPLLEGTVPQEWDGFIHPGSTLAGQLWCSPGDVSVLSR